MTVSQAKCKDVHVVLNIVIFVFVTIQSLMFLFTVNISTVSLLQMNIAVLMQTLLQVHLIQAFFQARFQVMFFGFRVRLVLFVLSLPLTVLLL